LFQEEYPEYYLARFAPNNIDVATVQMRLEPDELLVEYLIVAETIYAFVITNSSYHIYATNELKLNEVAGNFIELMSGQRTTDRSIRLDHISKELYRYLIEPLGHQLQAASSLIVIPDRVLFYFPFEMFQSDLQAGSPAGYLVNSHHIQYQPSLFLWTQMRIEERIPVKRVLTVAPSFRTAPSSATRESTFLPLDYASEESKDIHALWGGQLLRDRRASKANFIRLAPNSDIIHLATHAKADDRSGIFSWLAFSPQTRDSLLYLEEIYSLALNARMVVLSGCETGLGPLETGEGLISMSRAFSYAGAESIVTSLWPVNDASTAQIMSSFYQYLRKGEPKDKALQMAKLNYLEQLTDPVQADPYYWAGFIVMGDMAPMLTSSSSTPSWLIGVCILAGVCLLLLASPYFARRRK
jgi:CHAT domain-containing protein